MYRDRRTRSLIHFGAFTLDASSGELFKGPTRLKVPQQSIEILKALLESPGDVIGREDLRKRLWPDDTFVDFDHGLNAAMGRLRHALEDSAISPRLIETLPRRGYRFIGSSERAAATSGKDAAASHALSHLARRRRSTGGVRIGRRHSSQIRDLAVLPFEHASNDATKQYLADGMTESLIGFISIIGRLRVIARSSAMSYRATTKSLQQIAEELAVAGLIRGTVDVSDVGFRVDVALYEAASGDAVWSKSYERPMTEALRVQAEIAETIAAEIQLKLSANERRRFRTHRARSAGVHEAYLRARYHWNRETPEGLQRSFEYLSTAISRESGFAPCHAAMADWYLSAAGQGTIPMVEAILKAKAEALRALELDDRLAEAYASLGRIAILDWDLQRARVESEMAIRPNPNLAEPVLLSARTLSYLLLHDEAAERAHLARQLDPLSPRACVGAATVYYMGRKYDRAVEECRQALELEPRLAPALYYMGLSQLRLGLASDARQSLETAATVSGRHAATLAGLALVLTQTGRDGEAHLVLEEMKERATRGYVSPYYFAEVFSALQETDKALEYLRRSYDLHIADMIGIGVDPLFEALHGNPEFEQILRRLGVSTDSAPLSNSA